MQNKLNFGIDFGTTNTAVVCLAKNESDIKTKILGEGGNYPFSSIIAIPKDNNKNIIFGNHIRNKRNELSENYEIITSIKSYLGTDKEFIVNGERYNATDITTKFLQHIKDYIKRNFGHELDTATFSFPIDFSPSARRELKKSAINAGIIPTNFIGESSAVYMACAIQTQAMSKVMVIDWGGGTLDISVLDITKEKIVELSVSGDKVGGDDVDLAMAKTIHSQISLKSDFKIDFEDMPSKDRDTLINNCELAKIEFSEFDEDYRLTVRNYGKYGTKNIVVKYSFFESIVKTIITSKVLPTIENALKRANLTKDEIDGVVIVGGSSNIRPFANAITNLFGDEKLILPDDKTWVVAKGSALIDTYGVNIKLNDNLGILMSNDEIFTLLEKGKHGVKSAEVSTNFALVEDSNEANFIFVNENKIPFEQVSVASKGFSKEDIKVTAKITEEQTAKIEITNTAFGNGDNAKTELELNKLTFYYSLKQNEG